MASEIAILRARRAIQAALARGADRPEAKLTAEAIAALVRGGAKAATARDLVRIAWDRFFKIHGGA